MHLSFLSSFTGFKPYLASIVFTLFLPISAYSAPLPALAFKDENLKWQIFEPSNNKLTALHFWATWCVPCVKELPEVDIAQKKFADKGLKIIAISFDGKNVEKVKKFYEDNKIITLGIYMDPDMTTFQKLKIGGLPTTIFVNSKGEQIKRFDKPIKWQNEEIEGLIESNTN